MQSIWVPAFPSPLSGIPKLRAHPISHSEVFVSRPCHAAYSQETSLSRSPSESLVSAFPTCIYVGARSSHAQILLFLFPEKQDRVIPVSCGRAGDSGIPANERFVALQAQAPCPCLGFATCNICAVLLSVRQPLVAWYDSMR
jgi:hypothetical protein